MRVRFEIDDDFSAQHLRVMMTRLGYEPVRILDDDARRIAWGVAVVGGSLLGEHEAALFAELLAGTAEADIGDRLGLPVALVPRAIADLVAKTGSDSLAGMLARARETWDDSREAETRALAKRWGEALHGTGAAEATARALAAKGGDVVAAIGRVVDVVDRLIGVPQLQRDLDTLCKFLHGTLGVPIGARRRGGG